MSYDGNERITRRPKEAAFDRDISQNMALQYRHGINCASAVSAAATTSTNNHAFFNSNGFLNLPQHMSPITENTVTITASVLNKPSVSKSQQQQHHQQHHHLHPYHHHEDVIDVKLSPTDYYYNNQSMQAYSTNSNSASILENETKLGYSDMNYWHAPHLHDTFHNSFRNEMPLPMSASSNQHPWLDPYYMAASALLPLPAAQTHLPQIISQESSSIPLTPNRNYGNNCYNDFGFQIGIVPELEIMPSLKSDYEMEDENVYPMIKVQESQNKDRLEYQAINHHSMKSIDGIMSDDQGMVMTDEAEMENDIFDYNMGKSEVVSESMEDISNGSRNSSDDDCDLFTNITSYEASNHNNASVEDLVSAKMSVWSDDMKHIFLAGCKLIDSNVYRNLRENILNLGKSEPSPAAKLFIERLGQVRNLKSYMKMNNI